jgi:hypothetical protein
LANVVIIDKDSSLSRQMYNFVKEMDDKNEVRTFESCEEFDSIFFPTESSAANADEISAKRLSTIDLIIFGIIDNVEQINYWMSEVLKKSIQKKYSSKEKTVRFIVTKYEDDDIPKGKLLGTLLDDILFLPLDRLIFMQKLEILLGLPEYITPSYMYTQDVNFNVEISKRSLIEFISPCGFSIKNPVRLSPGAPAHFYAIFPELGTTLDFYAKAISSKQHPEDKSQYQVRFFFFGIDRKTSTLIAKFVQSKVEYKGFLNNNESHFKFSDTNIFATEEEKKSRGILIIDNNEQASANLRDILTQHIDKTQVSTETSYVDFYKKYLNATFIKNTELASSFDLSLAKISFDVDMESQTLEKCLCPFGPGNKILDYELGDFFSSPHEWRKIFTNDDAQSLLDETLLLFPTNNVIEKLVTLNSSEGIEKQFYFSFSQPNGKNALRIEISVPDTQFIQLLEKRNKKNPVLPEINLIIIDHKLVPTDFENWWETFSQFLFSKSLAHTSRPPKLILTGEKVSEKALQYSRLPIEGYFFNPVNIQHFLATVSNSTNNYFTKYNIDNLGGYRANLTCYIAKPAKLVNLSEFGATLSTSFAFKPGLNIFLHGAIYDNAPDKTLCIRAYANQEDPNNKNKFLCHFTYFGINESFLKFVRNWIREKYAQAKSKSSAT